MQSSEIRKKFLDFFKEKGHKIIPSASLIPENDPTVLFTTAGMQPLVPYLMGEKHPEGVRLANIQKCLRTDDIDEVGDTYHHTFFEMMGNWSLGYAQKIKNEKLKIKNEGIASQQYIGPYWKEEAIKYSWEFLTDKKWLGIDPERIAISVFAGDKNAPFDEESYNIWIELGVSSKRIVKLGKKHNWWPTGGKLPGPQGPDTEMFIWTGKSKVPEKFDPANAEWVEVWNDVFISYNKKLKIKNEKLKIKESLRDGYILEKLPKKNVDTGMGLERIVAIMQEVDDNYQTDLFLPIIKKIEELGVKKYEDDKKSFRIIADHLKAAVFIIGDENGAAPSNTLQGYVLRRLIRRAISYGKKIEAIEGFVARVGEIIIDKYKDIYPELIRNREKILSELNKEEMKFGKTIERGLKEFDRIVGANGRSPLQGEDAFLLFQSYGFPIEMTIELAKERGIQVDIAGFNKEFAKHQGLSRTASAGMFKGGLADSGEKTTKLHTAAHLLLASLRQALGNQYGQINQKGSNITAERLRFDFNYPEKLNNGQLKKIEDLVNKKIKENVLIEMMEMDLEKAKKIGATGVFGAKYGNRIKVYKIGEFSLEICGGPHVKNTGELGQFKIIKEESSSAGVRRIKAVLE